MNDSDPSKKCMSCGSKDDLVVLRPQDGDPEIHRVIDESSDTYKDISIVCTSCCPDSRQKDDSSYIISGKIFAWHPEGKIIVS